jgi:hypothetical protein
LRDAEISERAISLFQGAIAQEARERIALCKNPIEFSQIIAAQVIEIFL